jgi:RNA polymerase sigma factor (sigma-70 family)
MAAGPLFRTRAPFAEFYATYHPRILAWSIALHGRAEGEDVAQETMARALAAYGRLDPAADPWPWLVAIARNIGRDRHRAQRTVRLEPAVADTLEAEETPHDVAVAAERRRLVLRTLARMPVVERDLLVLREWHELGVQDIARLTGRSPGALRQHLLRARRRFAAEFTALGGRAYGLSAALSARWWRLRTRVAQAVEPVGLALPAAVQLAGAAAVVVAVAGPAPYAAALEPPAHRAPVAARVTGHAAGERAAVAGAVRRAVLPPAGTVGTRRPPVAGPPRGPSAKVGVAGLPTREHDGELQVPVGDRDITVSSKGRDTEPRDRDECPVPTLGC